MNKTFSLNNKGWNIIVGEKANGIGIAEYNPSFTIIENTKETVDKKVYVVVSEFLDCDRDESYFEHIYGVFSTRKKAENFINNFGYYKYTLHIIEVDFDLT